MNLKGAPNAANALKHFLIDQFIKFFLLINETFVALNESHSIRSGFHLSQFLLQFLFVSTGGLEI